MSNRKPPALITPPVNSLVLNSPKTFLDLAGRSNIPISNVTNARIALTLLRDQFGLNLSYDEFRDRRLVESEVLGSDQGQVSDDVTNALCVLVRQHFRFEPAENHMWRAVNLVCRENSFHPIKDYLRGLAKVHDGKKRIDSWLIDYMGAPDTELIRAIGKLVLVASVRRIFQPGCKFDLITVLESPEGYEKSSAIAALYSQEYFSDQSILGMNDKEVQEATRGRWGLECADLSGMKRNEVERIKAIVTRQVDRTRPAYGRAVIDALRCTVFWATTNESTYLRSQHGNRRFLPVPVGRIDASRIARDRDQLWAEAVWAEPFFDGLALPQKLWAAAGAEQDKRTEQDPWSDYIATLPDLLRAYEKESPAVYTRARNAKGILEERVTSNFILTKVLDLKPAQLTAPIGKRLADVMRKEGWQGPDSIWIDGRNAKGFTRPIDESDPFITE